MPWCLDAPSHCQNQWLTSVCCHMLSLGHNKLMRLTWVLTCLLWVTCTMRLIPSPGLCPSTAGEHNTSCTAKQHEMIKSLTFNQLLTYEGERFAQSFNITIERMLFFRWCQILVPKFWIGFQYWANVWNDSTICLWKTQQEVLDSPVLECRNWPSERPLIGAFQNVSFYTQGKDHCTWGVCPMRSLTSKAKSMA